MALAVLDHSTSDPKIMGSNPDTARQTTSPANLKRSP